MLRLRLKKIKELEVDMKGVKDMADVYIRLRDPFKFYYEYSRDDFYELLKRRKAPGMNWDAIVDLLSSLDELQEVGYDTLLLTVRNVNDVRDNISEDEYYELIYSLMRITDSGQRYDKIDVFVRITGDESEYPPYGLIT